MEIYVYLDYETHPASRAMGTFYVIELKDDAGNIYSNVLRGNKLYNCMNELYKDVNMGFGMPTTIIDVYEDD
ncbi:MAG: hypothetical protein ACOYLT_10335 [Flavobacterium sp.]|uniref:hypothetical protein n=1 Tax=Flavobacterium sp. TaxID=239 RepID=UPI003BEA7319